jgi:hypothetical protein
MLTLQRFPTRMVVLRSLPLTIAVTVIAGLIFLTAQQVLRMTANDPQIQLAEDSAAAFTAGQDPQNVIPKTTVDMATSLSPFVEVLADSGTPLAASVQLHGKVPTIPPGVLESARQSGEERVTWQPEPGVRSAAVIVRSTGVHAGFVIAGRSLREVEQRVDRLTLMVALAWGVAMLGIATSVALSEYLALPHE